MSGCTYGQPKTWILLTCSSINYKDPGKDSDDESARDDHARIERWARMPSPEWTTENDEIDESDIYQIVDDYAPQNIPTVPVYYQYYGHELVFPHDKDRDDVSIALAQFLQGTISRDDFEDIRLNNERGYSSPISNLVESSSESTDEESESEEQRADQSDENGSRKSSPGGGKRSRDDFESGGANSDGDYQPEATSREQLDEDTEPFPDYVEPLPEAYDEAGASKSKKQKNASADLDSKKTKTEPPATPKSTTRNTISTTPKSTTRNTTSITPNSTARNTATTTPNSTTPNSTTAVARQHWPDEVYEALFEVIRNLQRAEMQNGNLIISRDMKLFNAASQKLLSDYSISRSGSSCKNFWNRYGRVRSLWDEKQGKYDTNVKATSTQPRKPKK